MSQAKIHVERMMYRSSIAVAGETAASYALIKLIPTGSGAGSAPVGLNIALVLDVSGSMYEEDGTNISRLKRIQDAAIAALEELKPTDKLTIVAFAHNCQTLLPSTPVSEKAKIIDVIMKVDMFDVDPGGTAMDQGIEAAMTELSNNLGMGVTQMVVLTDGETSGEQRCRTLAQAAAEKKINLTVIGVGTDWNANLLKDLAGKGGGRWHYIDVNSKTAAEKVFTEEFQALAAIGFTNVQMHLRLKKDVKIKRVRQVIPEIKELATTEPEERHLVAVLGTLEKDKPSRYILDMSLPKRPDGKFSITDLEITYDCGKPETTGQVPLEVTYSPTQGYINAEVAKHIDEVQIFELNKNLQVAIETNNMDQAKAMAQSIEKKAEQMGPRAAKKTMLAKQVLQELNAGGRVSKKTQLAMDDNARDVAQG